MGTTSETLRRGFAGSVSAFGLAAALALPALMLDTPTATAAPDPCAASTVAKTVGSVATSTGEYLDSHPQTNRALTAISQQQAGAQSVAALKTYFDANPQVSKDLQALQQPLVSLSSRCKLPITMPQLLSLMQQAQQGGGLPGGQSSPAQAVGSPSVTAPAQSGPATVATGSGSTGSGGSSAVTAPLPGITTATSR